MRNLYEANKRNILVINGNFYFFKKKFIKNYLYEQKYLNEIISPINIAKEGKKLY